MKERGVVKGDEKYDSKEMVAGEDGVEYSRGQMGQMENMQWLVVQSGKQRLTWCVHPLSTECFSCLRQQGAVHTHWEDSHQCWHAHYHRLAACVAYVSSREGCRDAAVGHQVVMHDDS